jgi:hypothetical protein
MELHDYLNITDSKVRGVVVLKREDGSIVFSKENMIVQNGRKFIRDKFVKSAIIPFESFNTTLSSYSLSHIGFGNSDVVTEFSMTSLVSENLDFRTPVSILNTVIEENNTFIKFRAGIDRTASDTGYTLNEIGLIMTSSGSGEAALLFSRVVFDPVTVGSSERYEVEYYIYF